MSISIDLLSNNQSTVPYWVKAMVSGDDGWRIAKRWGMEAWSSVPPYFQKGQLSSQS